MPYLFYIMHCMLYACCNIRTGENGRNDSERLANKFNTDVVA